MKRKVWTGAPGYLQEIYDHMIANPQIARLSVPYAFYAWGDAAAIAGYPGRRDPFYAGEVVLIRKSLTSCYQANYWGYRFHTSKHPAIVPTVFKNGEPAV